MKESKRQKECELYRTANYKFTIYVNAVLVVYLIIINYWVVSIQWSSVFLQEKEKNLDLTSTGLY